MHYEADCQEIDIESVSAFTALNPILQQRYLEDKEVFLVELNREYFVLNKRDDIVNTIIAFTDKSEAIECVIDLINHSYNY